MRKITVFISLIFVMQLAIASSVSKDVSVDNELLPQFATMADHDRYASLTHEIRCLVCQNQSIADSESHFAVDLRLRLASWVSQGQSRVNIEERLRKHYGDKILFKPVHDVRTWLLWYGPYLLLFLVGLIWWRRRCD